MSFYCGIDLGAKSSQLCVINQDCDILLNKKVANQRATILERLHPFRPSLRCVVEATFNWYWLIDALQDSEIDVVLAHCLRLHMISKAKVKTDRRDAETLARLLRIGEIPEAFIYPRHSRPIRDMVRKRTRLVRMRAREYVALRQQLYGEGILDHSCNRVRSAEPEDLERWFKDPRVRLIAHQEVDRIFVFTQQIEELEAEIARCAGQRRGYRRLLQLPGVAEVLAAVIYYEIGDIHRFASAKNFSSYCRLVPGVAHSGETQRRGRGSKQGNPHLKLAFTQAAIHAVRSYAKIRRVYERHLHRHRGSGGPLIAKNIIARKLALAAFHMLRDGADYKETLSFGN